MVSEQPMTSNNGALPQRPADASPAGAEPITVPKETEGPASVAPPERQIDVQSHTVHADEAVTEQASPAVEPSRLSAGATAGRSATDPVIDPVPAVAAVPDATAEGVPEFEDLRLLIRFLVGFILMGSDELLKRVRQFQVEYERLEAAGSAPTASGETQTDRFRYFVIGSLVRNQRRAVRGIYKSWTSTGAVFGRVDRMTDNWLFRPVRAPLRIINDRVSREFELSVEEGRIEELTGRFLATQTFMELIDELVDYLSESPELAELVRDQIGTQSAGLAGTVVDNTRDVSASADNVVENLVRRIFRLPARRDLPRSPFAGQPGSFYSPTQGIPAHDGREEE